MRERILRRDLRLLWRRGSLIGKIASCNLRNLGRACVDIFCLSGGLAMA
jgi:hypothetical protein